jgi:hypothetical protein
MAANRSLKGQDLNLVLMLLLPDSTIGNTQEEGKEVVDSYARKEACLRCYAASISPYFNLLSAGSCVQFKKSYEHPIGQSLFGQWGQDSTTKANAANMDAETIPWIKASSARCSGRRAKRWFPSYTKKHHNCVFCARNPSMVLGKRRLRVQIDLVLQVATTGSLDARRVSRKCTDVSTYYLVNPGPN